jgi:hypothetical protein
MLGGFIGDVHVLCMSKLMGLIPAATSWWGCTNFFFSRAICPKCISKFILRHLEGVPSFKSKVSFCALVGAIACLGVCHGMPKQVDAAQFFFLLCHLPKLCF